MAMLMTPLSPKMDALVDEFSLRWNIPIEDADKIIRKLPWKANVGKGPNKQASLEVYTAIDELNFRLLVAQWIGGDGFHEGPLEKENYPLKWNIMEINLIS